jgi:hypothetical protein
MHAQLVEAMSGGSNAKRARSLFAQQREQSRVAAKSDDTLDAEAVYAVEQCLSGQCDAARQFVSTEFMEALREAAFALGVEFSSCVEPHFATLAEYDRCVYSWRDGAGHWATLMFDGARSAMLALVGAPHIQKLVGTFAYSVCGERSALRLTDVGPYAELLVRPLPDSSNVLLIVPEARLELELYNETPQRVRTAPALPSCFDGK